MLNEHGDVLYVGKAKSLKKRVQSYTRLTGHTKRIARMIHATRKMIFVTTHTEAEALLLEANLIKRFKPPFNVILRDDKSFPHILLRLDHEWAQITKHRGARRNDGDYYGPFASAGSVNRTLNTLQRVFLLRSCSDHVLASRTRPCLLHQIKRCAAPCVDRISAADYADLVADARAFLGGSSTRIQKRLAIEMQQASEAMEYEVAAILRDRLQALTQIQAHQEVNVVALRDADVIAAAEKGGQVCVQVFFYRMGQNRGNRPYFPRHDRQTSTAQVLTAFIGQFYDNKPPPKLILLSERVDDQRLIAEALSTHAGHRVQLLVPKRGEKTRPVQLALQNARDALARRLAESATQLQALSGVAELFILEASPDRIEVYDNSHVSGANAVGAMIVAGAEGLRKSAYRKFNIKQTDLAPGDDYGMMREVFTRRFSRLLKEDEARERGMWPDLVLIDGGRGQLSAVTEVLTELGVEDVPLVAISKGPDRNAGREQFHMNGRASFDLPPNHPVLYFLQRLRDEAHRFAIGTHRARRSKDIARSALDSIPGIGPKRKKALLHHFGSAKAVEQAGVRDMTAVDGISEHTAQSIYDHFHD